MPVQKDFSVLSENTQIWLEEYFHTSNTVKKSIKADEREYVNMLVTETEEAAHQGNLRELYTTIQKLSGKFGKPERPVKDKAWKPFPD